MGFNVLVFLCVFVWGWGYVQINVGQQRPGEGILSSGGRGTGSRASPVVAES